MGLLRKASLLISLILMATLSFAETKSTEQSIKPQPLQININTASAKELSQLNKIGAKKALRIILYREKHGAFNSLEDLAKVKGIGKAIIEKNRPFMVLGPDSELAEY